MTDGNAKSRLGGCIFCGYNSGAIFSFSRNDTTVSSLSHSSTEAEIKALDLLIQEIVHFIDICKCLRIVTENVCVPILIDNTSAITLCTTLRATHKTKTINMRINYIREMVNARVISLHFVPSYKNVADILTKPLVYIPYSGHRKVLLTGHGSVNPLLEYDVSNAIYHIDFVSDTV
ncbi:MAG: Ty1/Copia family ribonuclease HI [Flavobacteriales bacterium]|nr:Ty1/Copia family ribonuclease HI [Flavobacteriales bacterium]